MIYLFNYFIIMLIFINLHFKFVLMGSKCPFHFSILYNSLFVFFLSFSIPVATLKCSSTSNKMSYFIHTVHIRKKKVSLVVAQFCC